MNMKLAENKKLQNMNVAYHCMLFDLSKTKKSLFHTLLIGYLIGMVIVVPEGVLQISSDRDNRRMFLGLKFSVSRFFWVGKFWQVFFGQLDLRREFWGYSKQSEDS